MSTDQRNFPSRCAMRCGGISMIIAQILFGASWVLHGTTYDLYDVNSDDDVRALHDELSSNSHRLRTEISCGLMWISFPLLLIALYAIHGVGINLVKGTNGEMMIYLVEKSMIIWITVIYIILPASGLVSVSYDWEFYEYTIDDQQVPTGYYLQFYTVLLQLEIIDCAAIADACFMIGLFTAVRYMLYGSTRNNSKFLEFRNIVQPSFCKPKCYVCLEMISCCCIVVLFIIFAIILFEFAESGFFSPTGYAKFLIIATLIIKIFIGVRLCVAGSSDKYDKIAELFRKYDNNGALNDTVASSPTYQNRTTKVNTQDDMDELDNDQIR